MSSLETEERAEPAGIGAAHGLVESYLRAHAHYHCATEEALYVLSGSGTARIGDARVADPDSQKVAASAGTFEMPIHRWISRQGDGLDYWDGEPEAQ